MSNDELGEREQWTLFGNEAEKLEIGVIRNQHAQYGCSEARFCLNGN